MLVFVDESGDAGMKLDGGSSEFFVVTAILFEEHDEATARIKNPPPIPFWGTHTVR